MWRHRPLISHHRAYLDLGISTIERADACRTLLREVLFEDTLQEIRTYLPQQRALGRNDFQAMVEAKTRRFAGVRPAHRPRRED